MNKPRVFNAFAFSFLVHIVLIIASLLIISSHKYRQTTPYVVSIVDDISSQPSAPEPAPAAEPKTEKPKVQPQKKEPMKLPAKDSKATKAEQDRAKEQIEALAAKKRLEKLARLRKIVDVSGSKPAVQKSGGTPASKQGMLATDYESAVVSLIRQQWNYPEALDKDLEAVVLITIALDGKITIHGFEKKSGNALFDRSVLRAVNLASPLPKPQKEMDMGVKFRP
ncbi:MAG: TonB family protein [Nitrospiraceae bacterium]|nr:TonB family protein [Nitrospiraceae bacterium]